MVELTDTVIEESKLVDYVLRPQYGALLVFSGTTRDHHHGKAVVELAYEAYESMAVASLQSILDEAVAQFGPCRIAVSHRLGTVPVGQTSVCIAVGAPHRDKAYQASRYVIDELKARTPIWKKEIYHDGSIWKANATAAPQRGD